MEKEKAKRIRNWCEQMVALRHIELKTWESAPKEIWMPMIMESDCRIQIMSGINEIAEALEREAYMDIDAVGARRNCVKYHGITFFQIEKCESGK